VCDGHQHVKNASVAGALLSYFVSPFHSSRNVCVVYRCASQSGAAVSARTQYWCVLSCSVSLMQQCSLRRFV
jgi:hypothetical protein